MPIRDLRPQGSQASPRDRRRAPRKRVVSTVAIVSTVAMAGVLAIGAIGMASATDWPQFRGLHRDGISPEVHLIKTWPAAGPHVLWRVPIGEGYSHLAVTGGKVYTLFDSGNDQLLGAFDAATGKRVWALRIDSRFPNDQGNGPRSTPTLDQGLVYALSAQGRLVAAQAASGQKVWEHDLAKELDARSPQWGISSSPLVEGDLLLVAAGGSRGRSIAAFQKRDGKLAWTALDDPAGYAAPIAFTSGGVRQVVFLTGIAMVSLSPQDGKLLWRVPWETSYGVNAATPIFVAPDRIYVSSGYDTGAGVFRLKSSNGQVSAEPLWKSRVLKNQFSSSLLLGDYLYGFDNGTFKCVDIRNGEEKWRQRGLGQGSLILADGRLLVLSETGRLLIVDATPAGYVERASFQALSGRCWTGPSLADGVLYLRNAENMMAIDLAEGRTKNV
ncbi:MAG TPA: PQQ-binding-like beta-propeller repeat protein [Thermoanaerobaculia bacterium]|nr:PQQ-binding-like beta-propeller repeat protein [Thermoanaerobaculia bacterium]